MMPRPNRADGSRPDGPAGAGDGTPARFIAVEGIDGSGKTSVAGELTRTLGAGGAAAVLVDRHTAPALAAGYPGEHLRTLADLIWEYPADAHTSRLGFGHWSHLLAAWFHAVDHLVVRPALAEGRYVVADSWCPKFVARFALNVGLTRAQAVFAGVSVPDRVLWLDVAPEVCVRRRSRLRTTERGEWQGLDTADDGYLAYQAGVRSMYRALATAGGWRALTGVDRAAVRAELSRELVAIRGCDADRRTRPGGTR
jgi:dTMP kinase